MQPTKIEWLHWPDGRPGYSWNPIKGLCPVGCWYCYARKIYHRFGFIKNPGIPGLSINELEAFGDKWTRGRGHWIKDNIGPKKLAGIFVCSTFELFHPVTLRWRDDIFTVIKSHPEHTFFILTKLPQNIDRPMPENVWLGVSCDGQDWKKDDEKIISLYFNAQAANKFISFEPLLGEVANLSDHIKWMNWIIIGQVTGHGKKYTARKTWVRNIIEAAHPEGIPVFLKNNLAPIWPGKLIQEFPK